MIGLENLTVGGEVLAYCGKCKADTTHRIIAMVDGAPVKVECVSCHAQHKYRMAEEHKQALKKAKRSSGKVPSRTARTASTRKPRSASAKAAAALAEENARVKDWESRVQGRALSEFTPYSPKATFEEGQLIHHSKFKEGYVVRIIDKTKMEVMFEHGPRTLAQGLGQ